MVFWVICVLWGNLLQCFNGFCALDCGSSSRRMAMKFTYNTLEWKWMEECTGKTKRRLWVLFVFFFFSTRSVFQTWENGWNFEEIIQPDSGMTQELLWCCYLQLYSLVLANQPSMKHAYCWVRLLFYHFQRSNHHLQNWQNYRFLLHHIMCFFKTSINLSWWVAFRGMTLICVLQTLATCLATKMSCGNAILWGCN